MGFGNFMEGVGSNVLSGLITSQLTGGGASVPSVPQLPNQGPAADAALSAIMGMGNTYAATLPMDLSYLNSVSDNPYDSTLLRGAVNASTAADQGGLAALMAGLKGYGAADQVLNTGFDPRSALYNRTFQQNQQENMAANEAYGLGSSPYAAGLTNQANENFNIDWQNQQLQRQLQALQGYTQGTEGAGNQIQGAAGMFNTAGQLPYQAYSKINADQLGALQAYQAALTGATAIPQQQIADLMQYLGMGVNAANVGVNAANAQNLQQQQAAAGLYPIVSGGVQAGLNYFNSPNYTTPQVSYDPSTIAQPIQPVDTGLTDTQMPYLSGPP